MEYRKNQQTSSSALGEKQVWVGRNLGGLAATHKTWEPSRHVQWDCSLKLIEKNKATYVKYFIFHSTEFSSYTLFPQWNF